MKQLPLPIQLDQRATFDNFIVGENATAVNELRGVVRSEAEPQMVVWSQNPEGKTHLLQSLAILAAQQSMQAFILPMSELGSADIHALDNLEQYPIVCLDDVQSVCHDPEWSEALFHLINRLRSARSRLVMTANQSPRFIETPLADLASRLIWGPIYHLKPLSDDDLIEFVIQRGSGQGLTIPQEVVSYLIKFTRRDLAAMIKWVDVLDQEALAQQRRVTVPFVRSLVISSDEQNRPE